MFYIFSTYNYKVLYSTDNIINGKELFFLLKKYIEHIDYVILNDLSFDEWLEFF